MFTPITLDKERNLRYGMKALSRVEKRLNKTIGQIDFNNLSIEESFVFLWAGLLHEDVTLTVEGLMDIVDDNNIKFPKVMDVVLDAITDSFGEADETENPDLAATSE